MATKAPAAKPTAKAAAMKPAAKAKAGSNLAVVKKSSGALVSIKDQMAAEIAALASRTAAPGGDTIKLAAGKFKLPDGSEVAELKAVIVDFTSVNFFYEGAYNKDDISPPGCFAIGLVPTELVPSDNSPAKQSDDCAGCPMNQFGSSGNGKACKNQRRLALLPPDADEDTPLWFLNVSPTGLKSFDGYVRSVAAKYSLMPIGLVTTISMDPALDYPSLRFGDPQPNESMDVHWERRAEAKERLEQEPDVSQYAAPAPPKSRGKPAPRAAAKR